MQSFPEFVSLCVTSSDMHLKITNPLPLFLFLLTFPSPLVIESYDLFHVFLNLTKRTNIAYYHTSFFYLSCTYFI